MYRVEIKRSARRANAAAGRVVHRDGARTTFPDRSAADAWAAGLAADDATVWVQDAAPHDPAPVDGYLVARRSRREPSD